jgi:hypothetical protein
VHTAIRHGSDKRWGGPKFMAIGAASQSTILMIRVVVEQDREIMSFDIKKHIALVVAF